MKGMWSSVAAALLAGAVAASPWAVAQSGGTGLPKTQRVQVVSPGKDTPVVPVLSEDGKHLYYIKELTTGGDEVSQVVYHYRLEDGRLRLREVIEVATRFDRLRVETSTARP